MTTGLLLLNLGTPAQPRSREVGIYLRQFLMDARVVDIPYILRWLLVNLLIVPLRAKKSAKLYQKIWTEKGSPLLIHSQHLKEEVAMALGVQYKVVLGMRYGEPSIESAVQKLKGCSKIIVLPLFPQYAEASTGSAIAEVQRVVKKLKIKSPLCIQKDFYIDPGFVEAKAAVIQTALQDKKIDHLLFSYHGLPVRQVDKASDCQSLCDRKVACPTISDKNADCYRAQCFATTKALATQLGLPEQYYSTTFQSRLGKTPWIEPFTDVALNDLAKRGVKNLAIVCPSFVADCLETLEEINIRARKQWQGLGAGELIMIPCVNASNAWVNALTGMIKATETQHEKTLRHQPA